MLNTAILRLFTLEQNFLNINMSRSKAICLYRKKGFNCTANNFPKHFLFETSCATNKTQWVELNCLLETADQREEL